MQASEARFRDGIDAISEGFALYDEDERLVAFNEPYRTMLPDFAKIPGFIAPGNKFEDMVRKSAEMGLVAGAEGRLDEYVAERMEKFRNPAGPFEIFQPSRGLWMQSEERKTATGGTVCIRWDITEQKKAAEILIEREEYLRDLLEKSPMGVSVMRHDEVDGQIVARRLFTNRSLATMFGYATYEEWNHASVVDSWVDQTALQNLNRKLSSNELLNDQEAQRRRKDGSELWVSMSSRPIRFNDQDCTVVWHFDITERKRAQQELKDSEARFRGFAETASDWLWETDADGRMTHMSDGFFEVTGFPRDEIIGYTRKEIFARYQAALTVDGTENPNTHPTDVRQKKPFRNVQVQYPRSDGSTLYFVSNGQPVIDENDEITGFRGTSVDVTERRYAEEALRSSEERLASILEIAPEAIVSVSLSGEIQLFNKGAEAIFGCPSEEMIGQPVSALIPDHHQVRRMLNFERFKSAAEAALPVLRRGDITARRANGEDFPAEISVTCLDAGDQTVLLFVLRDVTDAKAMEQALRRSHDDLEDRVRHRTRELSEATAEAERANRAKSDFLSSMSHELRTPMNAILGFGQLLEMDPDLKDDLKMPVSEILNAGNHLLQLISEILNLSQLETGQMELNFETVDLVPLINEIHRLMGPSAVENEVRLSFASETSTTVWTDRVRLKQVLLNFLSNAVKYNRQGGSVVTEIEPGAAGMACRILVRDTGIGIADDQHDKVFEPFNRLQTNRPAIEGTGIGMAVSKRIAEAMGARLGFDSVLGEGTTFWLELPARAEAL
ncbi:MAG: PAS domain S-box protein [Proteobacteria bacterium]|nr:PAS domain S-box protein [Pseudomonadota bacterium]MDA1310669.1 PAS domain S-box protein [Pseudomonadota bacterium]